MIVVLMPLSQYKKKELYRHVDMFELADPKLFEDAVITENLCITTCRKNVTDKYNWMDLVLKSVDQRYIEFYKWNIHHNIGLTMSRRDSKLDKPQDDLNYKVDFVDSGRVTSTHGAIPSFRKEGVAYNWNYNGEYNNVWLHCLMVIHFTSEQAKLNFMCYAYNYKTLEERRTHLCGRALGGCHVVTASSEYYFAIPQLDWSAIHINQKELWDKGLYDEAVLAEMELKFDENGVIVKC